MRRASASRSTGPSSRNTAPDAGACRYAFALENAALRALASAIRACSTDVAMCCGGPTRKRDLTLARPSAACPERLQSEQRLQSILGVGPIVGMSLSNVLQRVPFRNAGAFVAFSGYDTRPDDSGQRRGRRRLSKRGPGELRRLLFNAAMSASQCEPWTPIYRHYRHKGLSSTAAFCIITRKIAHAAWSVFKYNTTFDPKPLTCQP
jgi:transposase IS116/IS110/IS902 family protein